MIKTSFYGQPKGFFVFLDSDLSFLDKDLGRELPEEGIGDIYVNVLAALPYETGWCMCILLWCCGKRK
jgi:hypothetical protein